MKKILRYLGLAPYSQVRHLQNEVGMLEKHLADMEKRLWARYLNRLKNDVHMSLSWFYSEHVKNVSMGTAVAPPADMWPYYPKAQLLTDRPAIESEKL